jgi:hypothetical protein
MAERVPCRCRGNCGLHEGDCGKPVEKPYARAAVLEGQVGPWQETGMCEACWRAINELRKRPKPT